MKIKSNAGELAEKYRKRIQGFSIGVNRGLFKATHKVNRAALTFLGGDKNAPAGSFPIPNRTGNLFRGQGAAVNGNAGYVFNTASYAEKIHQDRPWLDRAVDTTDVINIMATETRKEVFK